ncbi:MAG: ATP-binding protein, partial [Brotaphodocola sp.]
MNIKRAKQEIKDTIEAYLMKDEFGAYAIPAIRQRPILMIGPPGVGKTQIMEQISQECQIGLVSYTITHHTRQSAIGLPFIEKKIYGGRTYSVTEYTMSEIVAAIYDKIEQTGMPEGILFIDEINCVSETLAPTMLQFLQGKSFGNHRIPEGWIIVAAGNPPEYNKSVKEFDIVTLDRIRSIPIEPDFEAWKEYAVQAGIHPAIRAYLNIRRQYFCRIETTVDGKLFATPRGWEDLSQLILVYEQSGKKVDRDIVMEYIQFPKIAKDFANYLELYYKYQNDYQVEEILEGKIAPGVFDKLEKAPFDERVSVVGLLLSGLNEQFKKARQMEEVLEMEMQKLRQLRAKSDMVQQFSFMLEAFQMDTQKRLENGLVSRMELRKVRMVSAKLEEHLQNIRKGNFADDGAVWSYLRDQFAGESDAYEEQVDAAGEMLEYAFDFMEAAFAGGQEMVLFVTELNTGFYSLHFLQQYECERYYQYNKNLLFSEEEREIAKMLEEE